MKTQTQLDSDLNKTIHVCAVSQRGIYCNSHSAGKFSSVIPTTRDKVLMVYYSLETRVRQGRESLQLQSATSWRLCSPKKHQCSTAQVCCIFKDSRNLPDWPQQRLEKLGGPWSRLRPYNNCWQKSRSAAELSVEGGKWVGWRRCWRSDPGQALILQAGRRKHPGLQLAGRIRRPCWPTSTKNGTCSAAVFHILTLYVLTLKYKAMAQWAPY